jgi:capsular polysaccharide biosynthesis protein
METEGIGKYHNPIDYLKIVFRRKWMIITPTFMGLVFGIMACFLIAPKWTSSTIIQVEEEKTVNPLIQNLTVSTSAFRRMQGIREILLGWTSLVELTQKLGLDKHIHSQEQYEQFILGLRKNIKVELTGTDSETTPVSNIIKISYEGYKPHETYLVTKTLTDILMEKNLESQTKETDVAVNFIEQQLAIYKRKIKESEIAKMEDDLKALLQDSTEQHPMVKELHQKIDLAKKELASGAYEVTGQGDALKSETKEALKNELDKIVTAQQTGKANGSAAAGQSDANDAIYKVLLMDKVDTSNARDMDVNEGIYNMLLQKLETAKITQRLEASQEGTRYTIVDPPRLPLEPTSPHKSMIIFLSLFLGIVTGVVLAFSKEFLDESILDVEDAKRTLDLPLLGAISRITTHEEISREKTLEIGRALLGLLFGALLITLSVLFDVFKR